MQEQPWYAVRCLFRNNEKGVYEERTVLLSATTDDDAISLAERDAKKYAESVGCEYLGYADSFHIFDKTIENGTEIFSLMRTTDLNKDDYIDRYLDSGTEHRA